MIVSVVICTFNRSINLKKTLESFTKLIIPKNFNWELIVVDNNSDDNTKDVIEEFSQTNDLKIKYVFEKNQGLSFARNTGVKSAKGKIIAFTDDDVLVDKNWLLKINEAFNKYDAVCVGGKILPKWEIPPPRWLTKEYYMYFALLDYGNYPFYIKEPNIWGANFAAKAEVLHKYGLFDTNLGRTPKKLYGNEEIQLFKKILGKNEKILYHPDILVHHIIPEKRMTKRYIRKLRFDTGELRGILLGNYIHRNIYGIPLYELRRFIVRFYEYIVKKIYLDENEFNYQLKVITTLGFIIGRIRYKVIKKKAENYYHKS